MNLNEIENYEIKTSKTGDKLPVVNDVHLHSIYNPKKEAKTIATRHSENLKLKNKVLILGLGFGYHVNEIRESLRSFHGDNFEIIVIEPNRKTTADCLELELIKENNNLKIVVAKTIKEIYSDKDIVEFLTMKPAIIAHPSSFNLYNSYFKDFLSFNAEDNSNECESIIRNENLNDYLNSFGSFENIEQLIDQKILTQTTLQNNNDHMMLAYRHILLSEF